MGFSVLIPARLASTRLPGKPLADIGGLPMVVRVAQRAAQSGAEQVTVAADDASIVQACEAHGVRALLTGTGHASGSDRLAEACVLLGLDGERVVVNVQGDEPCFSPGDLARLAEAAARPGCDLATLCHPVASPEEAARPSLVKVVRRADGTALYFSRAPVPFDRERGCAAAGALGHVGIYAFRRERLLDYVRLPQGRLAPVESLEQLRALEAGWTIDVLPASRAAFGVDTPEDYERFVALVAQGRLDL